MSNFRRWLNALIVVTSVACLPLAAGLYALALITGGYMTTESCGRELGEPAVRYEQQLFPVIRKTCVGTTEQVEVVSPTVALPALLPLAAAGLGVLYIRREGRRQRELQKCSP